MSVRILLADDQPPVRAGLTMVIADTPGLEVVGEAATGAQAVRLTRELRPDVVVMDLRMPGVDGVEATRMITATTPAPHVLVLTTFDDDESLRGALSAGASGFLLKDMPLLEILDAIRVVASGEALIAPSVTRRVIHGFVGGRAPAPSAPTPTRSSGGTLGGVTDREREVLTLVGQGLSNAEIAAELRIGAGTVKTHVARLLAKLDARDRVRLVILAYESGLLPRSR